MESIPLINFELSFSKFCFRLPPQLPSLPPSHLHTFTLSHFSATLFFIRCHSFFPSHLFSSPILSHALPPSQLSPLPPP